MATCFLTLYFEVSTRVASNCVCIWPRVCALYLLLELLSDGIRVLIRNVSYTSKL